MRAEKVLSGSGKITVDVINPHNGGKLQNLYSGQPHVLSALDIYEIYWSKSQQEMRLCYKGVGGV